MITKKPALEQIWHYYWMFDPSHQRTESPTMVEQDDQAMSIFERSVVNIHDEIKKEAIRILKAKIVHNCQSSDDPTSDWITGLRMSPTI